LVAGGFPPSGSPKLLYLLTGLHRKYHVSSACSFQVAIETLKQKITSYAARLRRYQQRSLRYWQNKCFQRDEKRFYSKLLDDNNTKLQPPDLGQLESFWKSIFQKQSVANVHASWMSDLQREQAAKCLDVREPVIDVEGFSQCLRRLRNWAAPGPDGIQGFWIKRFPALHDVLVHHYNDMLSDGSMIPGWFPVEGLC